MQTQKPIVLRTLTKGPINLKPSLYICCYYACVTCNLMDVEEVWTKRQRLDPTCRRVGATRSCKACLWCTMCATRGALWSPRDFLVGSTNTADVELSTHPWYAQHNTRSDFCFFVFVFINIMSPLCNHFIEL